MNIGAIRRELSHKQMQQLTSKALVDGPFVVKRISTLGEQKEVTVEYPKTKRTKVIILEPFGG